MAKYERVPDVDPVDDERPHSEPHDDRVHDDVAGRLIAYEETVVERHGFWPAADAATRVNTVLFTVLLALEGLLGLRFALMAFGANRSSGFVDFIYDVSWPFVRPFDGAFANRTWDEGIIEVSTLLAMGVYALGFLLVAMLIAAVVPRYIDVGHDDTYGRHVSHGTHM